MKLTNTFLKGTMNLDINPKLMPKNQYGFAMNIEIANPNQNADYTDASGNYYVGSGQAKSGSIRTPIGNAIPIDKFDNQLLIKDVSGNQLVNGKCIGACADQATNSLYFLITSDNEDIVAKYTDLADTQSASGSQGNVGSLRYILRAPKTGPNYVATRTLGFNPKFLATGINYFNGYLLWTDNLNPPRMVKVDSFNELYMASTVIPWNQDDISVIVKPPLRSPKIYPFNDGTTKNYMKDRFIYFSYRFKYTDGRWSSMAPFSMVAFRPSVFAYNAYTGTNEGMANRFNSCDITVDTGDRQVTDIQLLFKDSEFSNVYIIETINKAKPIVGVSPIANNSTWTFKSFDNSKIYSSLPSSQLTRLFDNVPLKAQAQDVIGSRLVYGNYTQYYDLVNSYNGKVIPNYKVSVLSDVIDPTLVHASMKTNRDYQIGFLYLDDYGRMSTVVTSAQDTTNVPAALSGKRNWLKIQVAHYPPKWATKYRIAIKQNREKYYNIYPTSVFQDGVYSWFKLNNSDKDKVNEGDYVSVKTDYNGQTYSGNQYKVLEIKYLTPSGYPEGLYIKIQYITTNTNPGIDTFQPSYVWNGGYLSASASPAGTPLVPWYWPISISNFDSSYFVKYPQSAISSKVPYSSMWYTSINTPVSDFRIIISYAGIYTISGTSYHCLNYRLFNSTQNINPTPLPFRNVNTGAMVQVPVYSTQYTTTPPTQHGWINISSTYSISPSDTFRLSIFSSSTTGKTSFGGTIRSLSLVLPSNTSDPSIYPGAEVKIQIVEGFIGTTFSAYTTQQSQIMTFVSSSYYVDIQEWYYEDMIYNLFYQSSNPTSIGNSNVFFRLATGMAQTSYSGASSIYTNYIGLCKSSVTSGVMYMLVSSSIPYSTNPTNVHWMSAQGNNGATGGVFSIIYQKNILCLETIPKQNENPVFHECTEDLDIVTSGAYKFHGGNVQDQTPTSPAIIDLGINVSTSPNPMINKSFNCWAFPNGVESDRIRDDFNAPTMEWSPRVLVPVEEYKQEVAYANLTYSGTYNYDSPANNLNQFNLSLGNFKQLDKSFGSVQKIKSRDTDIVVLQQDKVSKVLFGKNLLSDSAGGGQITSIPEVLGTQIAYEGQFGISNNPESFAQWGDDMYFTDSQRGAVLRLNNQGLYDLSEQGMKSFFNSQFKLQPDTIKIGAVDPFFKRYFLTETDYSKKSMTTTITNPIDATPAAAYANMATTTVGTTSA